METGRERVLVIEDDAKLGRLVGLMLARDHEVLVATQAQEALDHIAAGERFDLILCDVMMPGVSGVDFHERVASVAPELVERIVFMTGGAFSPRAIEFLARTSIPWLEKPFGLQELVRFVREQLRRVGNNQSCHFS